MGTFSYGKHHKNRIGVFLAIFSPFNTVIIDRIKDSGNKRFSETLKYIKVSEYDEQTDSVWIEVHCKSIFDSIMGKYRHNVFWIKLKVDQEWSCMTDLGVGDINIDGNEE